MILRVAHIIKSSSDNRRHVCIDKENEQEILEFLKEDPLRMKKFAVAVELLAQGIHITDWYGREDISEKAKDVTAIKLLKGSQNIRLYCKEMVKQNSVFYIVIAELLRKKKTQKVSKKLIPLIEKVGSYEYIIKKRDEE